MYRSHNKSCMEIQIKASKTASVWLQDTTAVLLLYRRFRGRKHADCFQWEDGSKIASVTSH